jgi:hypothetical protein
MKPRALTRPIHLPRRQLALALQGEVRLGLDEQTRETLIKALADLLLEALGQELDEQVNPSQAANESENIR